MTSAPRDGDSMGEGAGKTLLFVVNDPAFFISHRLNIASEARARGYDVIVATPAGSAAAKIQRAGFRFEEIPLDRYGANPFREIGTMWALVRLYRRVRPDIIHHVTIKPVLYGSIAARTVPKAGVVNAVSGLGQVFTAGGLAARLRRFAVDLLYRAAFSRKRLRVIFQNRDDRERFLKRGAVREDATVLVPGAGVDVEQFAPPKERGPGVVVMFASRLLREKGVGEFVDAAARLKAAGSEARFVVVGDVAPGNPGSVSEEELTKWRGEGNVEFWGGRDDMPAVLAQAHVFCLPSYYGEGIPKALIEAASCGLPMVTADSPGCRELVRDGLNGLIVPPRDPIALASALEQLIASPDLRASLGSRARSLILSEGYSNASVTSRTLSLYSQVSETP